MIVYLNDNGNNNENNESNSISMNYIDHMTCDIQERRNGWKIKQTGVILRIHISSYDKKNESLMYQPSLTIQFLYTFQRVQKVWTYRKVSNIRRTLVGNKIVDHSGYIRELTVCVLISVDTKKHDTKRCK